MIITPEQCETLFASLSVMGTWEVKKKTNKNNYDNSEFDFKIKSLDSKYQESANCYVQFYGSSYYNNIYSCFPRIIGIEDDNNRKNNLPENKKDYRQDSDVTILNDFINLYDREYNFQTEFAVKNAVKFDSIPSTEKAIALDYFRSLGCTEIVDFLEGNKPIKVKNKAIKEQLHNIAMELFSLPAKR